jgi:hypothetical protein
MPSTTIRFSDLSQQKRFTTDLQEDLTPRHSVEQAIDFFLGRTGIPDNDLPWTAFSRGVRLDKKAVLEDLSDQDTEWTVLPHVSAGAR